MKFSTLLALSVAPLAMAKAVHNTYGRRTPMMMRREEAGSPDGKGAEKEAVEKASERGGQGKEKAAAPAVAAASVGGADAAVVAQLQALGLSGLGITTGAITNVILIWVNPGAGAATTTVNAAPAATVPPAAAAPPAAAVTHQVTVGGSAGLIYAPSEIKAAVGDMVVFTFMSANHTVTQSTFEQPCVAMTGGMDSGFQANPNNTVNPPPQVAMQVMVDTPLCKSFDFTWYPNFWKLTVNRVLLQAEGPLRKGHDFLHQPLCRQNPGYVPSPGHFSEWYR